MALLALAAATVGVSLALGARAGIAPAAAACPHAARPAHQSPSPRSARRSPAWSTASARSATGAGSSPTRGCSCGPAPHQDDARRGLLPAPLPGRAGPRPPGQEDRLHRRASGLAVRREPGLREHAAPDDRALAALAPSTAATCSMRTSATSASGSAGEPRWPVETTASSPPTRSSSAGADPDAGRMYERRHAWRTWRLDRCDDAADSRRRMALRARKIVFSASLGARGGGGARVRRAPHGAASASPCKRFGNDRPQQAQPAPGADGDPVPAEPQRANGTASAASARAAG